MVKPLTGLIGKKADPEKGQDSGTDFI